ncbi:type VII secretion target [Glycomyces sp. NPDC047010]|uniref:type VII secretion target n=1 Tax=Glycomyces sp. NPDC047010 TaxID=3155023 RepID=UPI0033FDEB38
MASGFSVDAEQLREHASQLDALKDRFDAVLSASSFIEQDDEAYGTLCGWISGCLEQRHQDQDDMVTRAQSNLEKAAQAIRECADSYESGDEETKGSFSDLEAELFN